MALGAYEIFRGNRWPEPIWPDLGFPDILKIAFRGRMISSLDHPVVQRLRGPV